MGATSPNVRDNTSPLELLRVYAENSKLSGPDCGTPPLYPCSKGRPAPLRANYVSVPISAPSASSTDSGSRRLEHGTICGLCGNPGANLKHRACPSIGSTTRQRACHLVRLTPRGRTIVTALLVAREADTEKLAKLAARQSWRK
ncbi:MAG: hypothetical protein GX456_14105 [Verrucomicrobia bacterium]|nr:hypothetical protein [Verrucomicrobiota bacterium]